MASIMWPRSLWNSDGPARTMPVLVIRGRDDRLSTADWARRLTTKTCVGQYLELAGAHTFPWRDPHAWSDPVQRFAASIPS